MSTLRTTIARIADWRAIAVLFVSFLVCTSAFTWRQQQLGHENKVLDVRFWYTPADVQQLMQNLEAEGRKLYAITQVTLDLAFPLVYGTIFAVLIFRLYGRDSSRILLWLPMLAVVADLLENVTTAYLALRFADTESSLAWFSVSCTVTKDAFLGLSLIVVLIGGIRGSGHDPR